MTKTVKELLGEKRNPYLRSKADQKFAADFTTDTSINNDDATEHEPNFKATNVASVEREKEGHGWDTEDISSKDGTDLEDADFNGTEKRLKAYKKLTAVSESSYGDKRDYPKIDIHHKGKYVGTTTWAKNTKVAKAKYLEKNPDHDPAHVKASYVKEEQLDEKSRTATLLNRMKIARKADGDNYGFRKSWAKEGGTGGRVMDSRASAVRRKIAGEYLNKRKQGKLDLKEAKETKPLHSIEDPHEFAIAFYAKHGVHPADLSKKFAKTLKKTKKTVKEQQYRFLQGTNISPSKQSKTLKKIANNSAKKADDAGNKADKEPWQKGNRSMHLNMMADALKQRSGVIKDYLDKRKSRAVKEEVLAELSKATLQSYVKKARKGLNKVRMDADKAVSDHVHKGAKLAAKNDDAGIQKLAHNVGKTSAKKWGRETGIPKAESKLRRSSQYTKIKAGDLKEEFEQLDEASKVELYGRYVSDIKTTMTEVGKLLSTLAKHNQEGWIDLYSIRETFNRVQILRDDISGSVEVAERDAAQRKKWAKEEQNTVSLREGVELFNNLPRKRNV